MSEVSPVLSQEPQSDFREYLPARYIDMTLAASGSHDAHGYIDNGLLLSRDSLSMPLDVYQGKIEKKLRSRFVSQKRKRVIRAVIEAAHNGETLNSGKWKG